MGDATQNKLDRLKPLMDHHLAKVKLFAMSAVASSMACLVLDVLGGSSGLVVVVQHDEVIAAVGVGFNLDLAAGPGGK
jgi:hypothetical protein